MAGEATNDRDVMFLPRQSLQTILNALRERGYTVVGPTISQDAITYDVIEHVNQLPEGWTDEQQAGRYRLVRREDDAWFGYVVGPQSWKRYLFPPKATLLTADRNDGTWEFTTPPPSEQRYAFLGVRACELAAISVQDRVFLNANYQDPVYRDRRENAFIIAVNCTQAASTCFCTSMGTGPQCSTGFDLALTEIDGGFEVNVGSDLGREVLLVGLPRIATPEEQEAAQRARDRAVEQITKTLDTTDLRSTLLSNLEHPRWDEVATRCLSCTNCTMVCPTCFCSSVTERRDLNGDHVERDRVWDSCFNRDFSYMAGGIIRNDIRSRYRQWLTHKLASWHDQFGTSGCVGCGRCITWCPVGIDLTEEVAAIREVPE